MHLLSLIIFKSIGQLPHLPKQQGCGLRITRLGQQLGLEILMHVMHFIYSFCSPHAAFHNNPVEVLTTQEHKQGTFDIHVPT